MTRPPRTSRRDFLVMSAAAPASLALAARAEAADPAERLAPTPPCGDDAEPTPRQTEGPYFTPSSPRRASLVEPGIEGRRIVVTGAVRYTDCRPVAHALLDFWQADDRGAYDNAGYRLRGHQFADAQGRYRLETIVPGRYPGRTRHVHVKVQAPDGPVLTTQLYFPGEPWNRRDRIFDEDLVVTVRETAEGQEAAFDFVLAPAGR